MSARGVENSRINSVLRPVIIGVSIGLIISIILLFLFASFITVRDTPQGLIDPMAIFALSVGAFISGLVCTRIVRNGGLINGLVCGLAISVLVLLTGLIAGSGGIGAAGIFRVIFIVISAMIGGVLGVNIKRGPNR